VTVTEVSAILPRVRGSIFATSVAVLAFTGCGGPTSPTATPTTATTPHWSLSGAVTSTTGDTLAGAKIEIVDGPNAGQSTTANVAGGYSFTGLTQSGFTVRASIAGFDTQSIGVNLTADTVTNFKLTRTPVAILTGSGNLMFTPTGASTWAISAVVVNTGTTCAQSISGTVAIHAGDGTTVVTLQWSAPGITIPAGSSATVTLGELSAQQIAAVGANGSYGLTFTFTSGC